MDITVNALNPRDEIAIRTAHSEYRFQITDPTHCRGVLRGGPLGEQLHDAVFTGAVITEPERIYSCSKLEVGRCALFYVVVNKTLKFLTTSPITNLAQI